MCRGILYGRCFNAESISFNIGTGMRRETVSSPSLRIFETADADRASTSLRPFLFVDFVFAFRIASNATLVPRSTDSITRMPDVKV